MIFNQEEDFDIHINHKIRLSQIFKRGSNLPCEAASWLLATGGITDWLITPAPTALFPPPTRLLRSH